MQIENCCNSDIKPLRNTARDMSTSGHEGEIRSMKSEDNVSGWKSQQTNIKDLMFYSCFKQAPEYEPRKVSGWSLPSAGREWQQWVFPTEASPTERIPHFFSCTSWERGPECIALGRVLSPSCLSGQDTHSSIPWHETLSSFPLLIFSRSSLFWDTHPS